jgi:para-nitrobenzyl esterase
MTTAQTIYGKVAGYIDRGVYVYKGIPYAKAGRFEEPEAPDSWEGVRSSLAYGPVSPHGQRQGWSNDQAAFVSDWDDGYPGEDCQRLNIWTPSIGGGKRPVMVWLHGGGFSEGSGQEQPCYDGLNLAKNHDVVLVSLNHRLNSLGFLDLSAFGDKYRNTGNLGMMDIVKALEWVRDNISNFGGDPSNVTIFGQSGGGGKVTALMAMPSAKGLFQKAIVESGSIIHFMDPKYSRRIGVETVRELGLSASTIEKIKTVPYDTLLAATRRAIEKVRPEAAASQVMDNMLTAILFGAEPVVDGEVIVSQPDEAKALEISKDVPVIIGTVRNEFASSFASMEDKQLDDAMTAIFADRKDSLVDAYNADFPGAALKDIASTDYIFRPLAYAQAKSRVEYGCAPVYMYLFTWESPVLDGVLHSSHCMEIPFVFDNVARQNTETGGAPEAIELGHRISSLWTAFAREGTPEAEGIPEWKPFTAEGGEVMFLDVKSELRSNPDAHILALGDLSMGMLRAR